MLFPRIERRLIMTHTKRITAIMLMLIMLVSLLPSQVFAAKQNGWVEVNTGYWYYYVDGELFTGGWKKIGGKWYYFASNGLMASNTFITQNSTNKYGVDFYYVDKSGAMVTSSWFNWKPSEKYSYWIYATKSGKAALEWKKIDGKWYFFNPPGFMCNYPSQSIDGKVYVFGSSGALVSKTGWVSRKYEGSTYWFYVKKGGIATVGWKRVSGKWYYFKSNGTMVSSCTMEIENSDGSIGKYKFDKNGVCLNP